MPARMASSPQDPDGLQEAWHVPLIVADPSGRFCKEPQVPRDGLVSSVDILRLLVISLGHNGSQDWMTGDYETLYGQRHDVLPMLRSHRTRRT